MDNMNFNAKVVNMSDRSKKKHLLLLKKMRLSFIKKGKKLDIINKN